MFDDTKKELQKLEQKLLQEEEFENFYRGVLEEYGTEDRTVPTRRRPAKRSYGDAPRAVVVPKKKSIRGLVLTVTLELIGISALALYWIMRVF